MTFQLKLIISAVLFLLGLAVGFGYEYNKFTIYKTEVATLGKTQEETIAKLNKQIKDNAHEAEQTLQTTTNNINAWYRTHPVRVFDPSCGKVPGSNSSTAQPGQAGGQEVPQAYISEYTPEETELLANQLDQLLQLLHRNGVTFE